MVSTADVITWIACGRGGEPVLDGPSEVDCWARVATARRTAGSSIASTDADVRSRTLDCPSACAALSSSTMKNGAVKGTKEKNKTRFCPSVTRIALE